MLSSLQIENVAVIQKAEVHFEPGLNVLTGETGAGKSIVIDALGAAPGDSTCFNPVRGWLTLGGYRIDDAGTLWLTVTSSDTASGIVRTQALACLVLSGTALDGVSAVGLEDTDGDALYAPLTANDLALTDPATDAQS